MSTAISERIKLTQEALIPLLIINHPTAGIFRFSTGSNDPNDTILFDGDTYLPRGFKVSSMSVQGTKMPRPTLTIDNVDDFWYQYVAGNNELRGATVRYMTVYRDNLDANQILDDFEFVVKQMQQIDANNLQLSLHTAIDVEKAMFGRQCLRRVCDRSYRVPISGSPDTFTQRRCPYVALSYFERDGTPTANWLDDACGRDVPSCELRFGTDVDLPIQAFPSVGQREV